MNNIWYIVIGLVGVALINLSPILIRRIMLSLIIRRKEKGLKLIKAKQELNKDKNTNFICFNKNGGFCYVTSEKDIKFIKEIDDKISFLKDYDRDPYYTAFAVPFIIALFITIFCSLSFLIVKNNYNQLTEEKNYISEYVDYTSDDLNKFGIYQVVIQEVNDYNRRLANYKSNQTTFGNWTFWKNYDLSEYDYITIKGQS